MSELADMDTGIVIIPVFGMLQKVGRDLQDVKKTQNWLLEIKNLIIKLFKLTDQEKILQADWEKARHI